MGATLHDLPAEIRSMIYQQLFPNICFASEPLIAHIRRLTKSKTRLVNEVPVTENVVEWLCCDPSFGSSPELLLELPAIVALLLTSRFPHQEVSRIFYPNILPTFVRLDASHNFSCIIGRETRLGIHVLSVPMANSTTLQRKQLIQTIEQMTFPQNSKYEAGLHTLILTKPNVPNYQFFSEFLSGIRWTAYILQNIKALQKKTVCPQLIHVYYRISDKKILMSAFETTEEGYVKVDVEQQSKIREEWAAERRSFVESLEERGYDGMGGGTGKKYPPQV